jgi:hypothetical protein
MEFSKMQNILNTSVAYFKFFVIVVLFAYAFQLSSCAHPVYANERHHVAQTADRTGKTDKIDKNEEMRERFVEVINEVRRVVYPNIPDLTRNKEFENFVLDIIKIADVNREHVARGIFVAMMKPLEKKFGDSNLLVIRAKFSPEIMLLRATVDNLLVNFVKIKNLKHVAFVWTGVKDKNGFMWYVMGYVKKAKGSDV